MKKFLFFTIFTVFTLSNNFAQKVGYVNSQEILAALPEVKQANSEIEVMKSMFQKKGEEMIQAYQTKMQDLQQKQAKGEIAPAELEKQGAGLELEKQKILEFERTSQDNIYKKSEELLKPVQTKVNDAIKAVATEEKFTYILDAGLGFILYSDPTAEATKLVLAKLGVK